MKRYRWRRRARCRLWAGISMRLRTCAGIGRHRNARGPRTKPGSAELTPEPGPAQNDEIALVLVRSSAGADAIYFTRPSLRVRQRRRWSVVTTYTIVAEATHGVWMPPKSRDQSRSPVERLIAAINPEWLIREDDIAIDHRASRDIVEFGERGHIAGTGEHIVPRRTAVLHAEGIDLARRVGREDEFTSPPPRWCFAGCRRISSMP